MSRITFDAVRNPEIFGGRFGQIIVARAVKLLITRGTSQSSKLLRGTLLSPDYHLLLLSVPAAPTVFFFVRDPFGYRSIKIDFRPLRFS